MEHMEATGAAFRLVWNRAEWDLSNIDIYHTLKESNEIYEYGAKALGRDFDFIGRDDNTKKEDFAAFIKSKIEKGFPVIALGIIGPPEPCIGAVSDDPSSDKEIIKMASDIMRARNEGPYAKGISAYDAWKDMLLDEKWFENGEGFDYLFSKLLVQNDAITCVCDGRKWGAKYFEELSAKYGDTNKAVCRKIAKHFQEVSSIADAMALLIGDWSDMEKMLKNFGNRDVREKIGNLIDTAKSNDILAYEQIKLLLESI